MVFRKAGQLLPLELKILEAGIEFALSNRPEFHAFGLASQWQDEAGSKLLIAHGTLYRTLQRLESRGFLESRWEAAEIAEQTGRPRRRFYKVTADGAKKLAMQDDESADRVRRLAWIH
jgi:PadR family transcriptional regulator, regulatory protein PadR